MGKNTEFLNLNKPEYGSSGWDKDLNENFDILDQAVSQAMDGQAGYYIGDEPPLSPKNGQVWIDTSNGGVYGSDVYGQYKVYNGESFESIIPLLRLVDNKQNEYTLSIQDGRLGTVLNKEG